MFIAFRRRVSHRIYYVYFGSTKTENIRALISFVLVGFQNFMIKISAALIL